MLQNIHYICVLLVAQLQQDLLLASDKERSATDIAVELKSKVKALNLQLTTIRKEKMELEIWLEDANTKNKELKEAVTK